MSTEREGIYNEHEQERWAKARQQKRHKRAELQARHTPLTINVHKIQQTHLHAHIFTAEP